jgi:hypothetical protein
MFRKKRSKKRSKKKDEARDVSIRELVDAYGPTPSWHKVSEPDEEQDEHEFTEKPDEHLDEETANVAGNGEARPATEDVVADKVNTIWRQRLEDDPEGALVDLRDRVDQLGYRLAYAGRTYGAPVTKRTYYIVDQNKRRMDIFHDGVGDLTLLDVCLWSEVAFKRVEGLRTARSASASPEGLPNGSPGGGLGRHVVGAPPLDAPEPVGVAAPAPPP